VGVVLGLIGIVIWIVVVIALAAGVTWVVVKVFPTEREPKTTETPEPPYTS
jgi:hypothetical protein